ncbi:MAG: hypothetical protein WA919_03605 [Coleofasciculaceae cyanobacterium]
MFVLNLSIDKWVSNTNDEELIENPNWEQIEAAIRQLEGKRITLVTLGAGDETYMTIGNGYSGKYIVSVTFDNLDFYNLIDLSKSDVPEKLVVGGQEGIYSSKICVDLLRCLLAARTFAESGKLDPLLTWESDKSLVEV